MAVTNMHGTLKRLHVRRTWMAACMSSSSCFATLLELLIASPGVGPRLGSAGTPVAIWDHPFGAGRHKHHFSKSPSAILPCEDSLTSITVSRLCLPSFLPAARAGTLSQSTVYHLCTAHLSKPYWHKAGNRGSLTHSCVHASHQVLLQSCP